MAELTIEIIADPDEGGFTARVPDIPAYGEGETEDDAIADLKVALAGYVETFGLQDALARVVRPTVRKIDWDLAELSRG
ncbi:MAG: HicB like antitoxin of bacterial toxin-antitoxin system [Phycisphaerales bacterium]|jgi:predicted RNase H-like HicB family nuclease|nr:HicB like antitoxin of bacterial toxin-antitoxin system [Phycisphaerales bacterium]